MDQKKEREFEFWFFAAVAFFVGIFFLFVLTAEAEYGISQTDATEPTTSYSFPSQVAITQSFDAATMSSFGSASTTTTTVQFVFFSSPTPTTAMAVKCRGGSFIGLDDTGAVTSYDAATQVYTVEVGNTWFDNHSSCDVPDWAEIKLYLYAQTIATSSGSGTDVFSGGSAYWYANDTTTSTDANVADLYFSISNAGADNVTLYEAGTNDDLDGQTVSDFGFWNGVASYPAGSDNDTPLEDVEIGKIRIWYGVDGLFGYSAGYDETYYPLFQNGQFVFPKEIGFGNGDWKAKAEILNASGTVVYSDLDITFTVENSFFSTSTVPDVGIVCPDATDFWTGIKPSTWACWIKKAAVETGLFFVKPHQVSWDFLNGAVDKFQTAFPFNVFFDFQSIAANVASSTTATSSSLTLANSMVSIDLLSASSTENLFGTTTKAWSFEIQKWAYYFLTGLAIIAFVW